MKSSIGEHEMSKRSSHPFARYRIGLVEAFALCIVVAAAVWYAAAWRSTTLLEQLSTLSRPAYWELQPLQDSYGPGRHSRHYEEWIIRDYFKDKRHGVFLDVGANHYQTESNTYFLETSLGWSGIAVDALPEFGPDYAVHRPRTRYVAMFAADVADASVQFFVPPNNHLVSSADREFVERQGGKGEEARVVPTTTLNAVLDDARIDFLNHVMYVYVGAGVTSNTWTMNMPSMPGTYEFRLFLNNGYTRAATSPTITVGTATPPQLSVSVTSVRQSSLVANSSPW